MASRSLAVRPRCFDNTYPDFAAALKISNTLCGSNGGSTYVSQCDDAATQAPACVTTSWPADG